MIADILGEIADGIFSMQTDTLTVSMAWLGAITYSLQIYFDFSGYSDMAIGLGKIMGFDFPENFNLPYISKTIREFWRRWHMSLSSWFRDYVYIPLGGSRKGNVYLHLIIVFLLTGLWHGANYTFVAWGLWHGFFIVAERFAQKRISIKFPTVIKHIYTALVVVTGWVMFRSDSIEDAFQFIMVMFGRIGHGYNQVNILYYLNGRNVFTLIIAMVIAFGIPGYIYGRLDREKTSKCLNLIKNPFVVCILIISLMMVVNRNYSPFIYFRF